MKKIKLLSSLGLVSVLAGGSPILATSCSNFDSNLKINVVYTPKKVFLSSGDMPQGILFYSTYNEGEIDIKNVEVTSSSNVLVPTWGGKDDPYFVYLEGKSIGSAKITIKVTDGGDHVNQYVTDDIEVGKGSANTMDINFNRAAAIQILTSDSKDVTITGVIDAMGTEIKPTQIFIVNENDNVATITQKQDNIYHIAPKSEGITIAAVYAIYTDEENNNYFGLNNLPISIYKSGTAHKMSFDTPAAEDWYTYSETDGLVFKKEVDFSNEDKTIDVKFTLNPTLGSEFKAEEAFVLDGAWPASSTIKFLNGATPGKDVIMRVDKAAYFELPTFAKQWTIRTTPTYAHSTIDPISFNAKKDFYAMVDSWITNGSFIWPTMVDIYQGNIGLWSAVNNSADNYITLMPQDEVVGVQSNSDFQVKGWNGLTPIGYEESTTELYIKENTINDKGQLHYPANIGYPKQPIILEYINKITGRGAAAMFHIAPRSVDTTIFGFWVYGPQYDGQWLNLLSGNRWERFEFRKIDDGGPKVTQWIGVSRAWDNDDHDPRRAIKIQTDENGVGYISIDKNAGTKPTGEYWPLWVGEFPDGAAGKQVNIIGLSGTEGNYRMECAFSYYLYSKQEYD